MYIHIYINIFKHIYICIYIGVCIHIYMFIYIYVYIYVCMYTYIYICINICIHKYSCTYNCVNIYTYIFMYTYIYIYMLHYHVYCPWDRSIFFAISVWCTHTNSYSWLGWLVLLACLLFCGFSDVVWSVRFLDVSISEVSILCCVYFLFGPSWLLWRSVFVKGVFIEVWWLHAESIRLLCGYIHTHIYIYIWTHHSQIDKNVNMNCYHQNCRWNHAHWQWAWGERRVARKLARKNNRSVDRQRQRIVGRRQFDPFRWFVRCLRKMWSGFWKLKNKRPGGCAVVREGNV